MKWFHLLLITTVAFSFNACQKHEASELKLIGESNPSATEKPESKFPAKAGNPSDHSPAPEFFPSAK